jgi:hypothetical protein
MVRSAILALTAAAGLATAVIYFRSTGDAPQSSGVVIVQGANAVAAQPAAAPPASASIDAMLDSPEGQHQLVRSEARDAAWASRSEASIKTSLENVPFLGVDGSLQTVCATSLCEVSGEVPAAVTEPELAQYWQLLQGAPVRDGLSKQGLEMRSAQFGRPGNPRAFSLYFKRPEPAGR